MDLTLYSDSTVVFSIIRDNNVYEEPKQPERPKVPPSPAKRPEVPPSPKVKESAKENEVKKEEEEESQTQYEDDDDTYSSPPSNRPVISPPENTMYQVNTREAQSCLRLGSCLFFLVIKQC